MQWVVGVPVSAASTEGRRHAGHGADADAEDFIAWIGEITGFTARQ
jgi:hypothetical protein